MDLHYYGSKLAYYLRRVEKSPWPWEDKILVRRYIEHCRAQGLSVGRLYKITWTLFDIRNRMKCTFRAARRKDIEALVADINSSGYTATTRSDHGKVLKKFYKFVRHGNADTLQELLRKTIFRFLGVRYEGKVVRPPITNIVPIVYGVECSINGETSVPSLRTGGEYTHLVISGGSSQTIVNDDGSVTKNPTMTYTPVGIPEGAQLVFTGSRIYGEKGKIKKAGVVDVGVSDTKP